MSVTVKIGGSIAGLKAALTNGKTAVGNWSKSIKSMVAGIGTAFAAFGLTRSLKGMIDDLDTMSKRARAMGVTVEEMQLLEYAAKSANMGLDQLSQGMARSMQLVSDALGGDEKAIAKLERLNVSIDNLKGAGAYQIIEQIAAGLVTIEDPVERISALMDVMGAKVGKNVQFFTDFADRVQALRESGGLIRNEDAQAAEAINQALTNAARSIRSIVVDTGILRKIAEAFGWAADVAKGAKAGGLTYGNLSEPNTQEYHEALPFRPSTTSVAAREAAAAKKLADAVDTVADNVTAKSKKLGSVGRGGGGDSAMTDSLRRVGGDLGYNYRGNQQQFVKAAADASERAAAALEAINQQGVTLRG